MKLLKYIFFICSLFHPLLVGAQENTTENNNRTDGIYADFNTNKGRITVVLYYMKTPVTVANFIGLAEGTLTNSTYPIGKPFFDGSIWHRVVKGHVIQGGEPATIEDPATYEGNSIGYEIPNEISNLSHNKAGMLGMANGGPHTNTCEYYITLGDRSYLDGNYTLFGEVINGMDVVNNIEKGDTTLSVEIFRIGNDAKSFVVNDLTFKVLLDNLWAKVRIDKVERDAMEEKFISGNYPGLTILPGGLRYKIISPGQGSKSVTGDTLNVAYTGRLINGLTFISSSQGGNPEAGSIPRSFTYTCCGGELIQGLKDALQDMKQGEKRLLVIPPDLGYGINNAYYSKEIKGQKRFVISPGETLIVEVVLNNINH